MNGFFVEPCPGCFENQLQALSEQEGNPVFLSAGDFTLKRLLEAMSRQVYGGDVLLCVFRLYECTLEALWGLQQQGMIGRVRIVYGKEASFYKAEKYGAFEFRYTPSYVNMLSIRNEKRMMTVTGWFSQQACSLSKECYTMINDPETQTTLRKVFERLFF
jgi:hypothetical protein